MVKLRNPRSGFSLLESLIAMAVLSIVLTAVYATISQTISRQSRVATSLEQARLGRAILTEYAVTWPAMRSSGQLGNRYRWIVKEIPLPSSGEIEAQLGITYVQLDVTIEDMRGLWPALTLSTAMTQVSQ